VKQFLNLKCFIADSSSSDDPMAEVINILRKIPKDKRFGAMAQIMANLQELS